MDLAGDVLDFRVFLPVKSFGIQIGWCRPPFRPRLYLVFPRSWWLFPGFILADVCFGLHPDLHPVAVDGLHRR